ncbi:SRPBCC family protein [Rhodoferax saidenbachensis]|uniref:Polyketide cyclase n=1 Tax=Rhodoferax saidenbachensis TaxID=1484693 RepID=A0A1P8KCJ5_9BURK|nr:SRPBCC family protein [Rhodoferax saidenbachensis]APW43685.1 polyketide cyclase [Rhodoferax saidenbachensis]
MTTTTSPTKPSFVYVTYIQTTPEKVWQAFVDTDVMAQYWFGPTSDCVRVNVSDWKVGSTWEHQRLDGARTVDICGKVVECDPPKRLVMSWARPSEAADTSKHSRVEIDIEQRIDGLVRLTVSHCDLERDPKMLEGISGGWPAILSNLKTLLETGHALPRMPGAA